MLMYFFFSQCAAMKEFDRFFCRLMVRIDYLRHVTKFISYDF